jgi:hypothetical protein
MSFSFMTSGTRRSAPSAVERAMAQLVRIEQDGGTARVQLPLFYPSGASVAVSVERVKRGYVVSDNGLAYREIEMVGAERSFARTARGATDRFGVEARPKTIFVATPVEGLATAIADVAGASAWLAQTVIDGIADHHQNKIAEHLYGRLVHIFGQAKVEPKARIVGASTNDWEVTSLVHLGGRDAIFDVVSNHHASVFSTATKFHDLALLSHPPVTIAVIQDKKAMGAYYGILAQAGHVIQDNEPDSVIVRATAA